jgi:hypothetical protein
MLSYVFVYLSQNYQFVSDSITVTTTTNYHFIKRKCFLWLTDLEVSVHDYFGSLLLRACDRWYIMVVALGGTIFTLR